VEVAPEDVGRVAPERAPLGVVLLTFNSASVIERTVAAARQVSPYVVAVDSSSTDGTPDLLRRLGCTVESRPFRNYADQRNWAIALANDRFDWQLHLDADEVMDARAIAAVRDAVAAGRRDVAYVFRRRTWFLGRRLRFGGTSNWHLRLFRSGTAVCEDRLYDQHFVSTLRVVRLAGDLDDLNVGDLQEWVARHNRWSTLEAEELDRPTPARAAAVTARLSADPRERRRLYKGLYYRAPPILRACALFVYRYVIQFGWLDGREGFLYAALQTFWFRVLVDAKLIERRAR
jgi:glycosyltransferase involved in cell wall biosynthesis